jgi:ribosomal protein S18 acetylase RimI-like enzyme
MMNAMIREARPEDFEAVFALVLELREHFAEKELAEKEGMHAIYRRFLANDDHHVYVAEADGRPVALMNISILQSLYDHRPYVVIDELIVTDGYRGQGIGKQLVDKAFRLAYEGGYCEVCVDTAANNERAIRFYRDCGFDQENILFEKELTIEGDG